MLEKALEYAEFLPVFPLIPNGKAPATKDGFYAATQDVDRIKEWWTKTPNANIGVVPALKGYVVLDLDTADDTPKDRLPDGAYTLSDIGIWNELNQIENNQFYKTPSGGLHYWFKTDSKILLEKRLTGINALWDGVEWLGGKGYSVVPPSTTDKGAYSGDLDLASVPVIPDWLQDILVNRIEEKSKGSFNFKSNYTSNILNKNRGKNFTGILLDRIVNGADSGSRNVWLTSITGSLFSSGMEIENILLFMQVVNEEFINPPLNNKELTTIFRSILNREGGK